MKAIVREMLDKLATTIVFLGTLGGLLFLYFIIQGKVAF